MSLVFKSTSVFRAANALSDSFINIVFHIWTEKNSVKVNCTLPASSTMISFSVGGELTDGAIVAVNRILTSPEEIIMSAFVLLFFEASCARMRKLSLRSVLSPPDVCRRDYAHRYRCSFYACAIKDVEVKFERP